MNNRTWLAGLTLGAALLLALPARGATGLAVELLEPAVSTALPGGLNAVLEWRWVPGATIPEEIVEWEAFLSLDGGANYPYRITPHLNARTHRAAWPVPAIPSDDARLLLRVGNGIREREIELPHRFRIEVIPSAPVPAPRWTGRRGEAARPGDPEVFSWVEVSADGRSFESLTSATLAMADSTPAVLRSFADHLQATEEDTHDSPHPLLVNDTPGQSQMRAAKARPATRRAFLPAISILRLTTRQNE